MYNSPTAEPLFIGTAWHRSADDMEFGKIADSILPADIFARYHRMAGHPVLMISGSDAHAIPIPLEGEQGDISLHELAVVQHQRLRHLFERLAVSFDLYTNTDTTNHLQHTQKVFLELLKRGDIFKDSIESPYCSHEGRFLPPRHVRGTCPYCNTADAYGEQCPACGRILDPAQLLEACCRLCGSERVEMRETEHFFLDVRRCTSSLRRWLQSGKEHWRPRTLNFALNSLKEGLVPPALTRDADFGIPVPLPGYEDKRIQLWFDVLIGYYSASIEWAERQGDPDSWRRWWETATDSSPRSYFFVGQDTITLHTIQWPAILMGMDDGLALPYDVPAGMHLNVARASRPVDTDIHQMLRTEAMLDRYGVDTLRFYLSSVLPEQSDNTFVISDLVQHNNDQLVAAYGNVVHRVLTFVQRNFRGMVPPEPTGSLLGTTGYAMLEEMSQTFIAVGSAIESVHLQGGLIKAMALARGANRYMDERAPWKSINTDPAAAATAIHVMIQVLNGLKVLFAPYLPLSSQKLHHLLGCAGNVSDCRWEAEIIPSGRVLPPPTPLFKKIDTPPLTQPEY